MEQFERYDKGELLRDRYLKVNDISEGSYGLVSVAKDTRNNDCLVAVKFIYPVDYKKDHQLLETTSRPSSSPAKMRNNGNNKNESDSHDLQQKSNVSKPTRESIFNTLYNEAQKEIKFHKILGDHPHISKLYDHFDTCLILEFCSRGDLYEAIHSGNGPVTTPDIKDVFQQILTAVEYCHSRGVYHRDLKPENILIAEDWSIKICDWGLATTSKIVTNKDEFDIGSERYMAPELFDNNLESYDASKIDIWSVGVILLTLVFHKNPFQVANYSDKRFIQFVNNREALFDIFSTMSGDLFSVLRFSLTIDPDNRDLKGFLDELMLLRYFTIDEEYWASEYDDDGDLEEERVGGEGEENEGYYDDDDDDDHDEEEDLEEFGFFDDYEDKLSVSPQKLVEIKATPVTPVTPISNEPMTNQKLEINPAPQVYVHKSSLLKSPVDMTPPIPHNRRADALLSTNTDLKPIPIHGTAGFKFHRNTRKPLNVASYTQNSYMNNRFNNTGSSGFNANYNSNSYNNNNNYNSKFNREDFFTPKSVFNHYLDKYGEQKFGKQSAFADGYKKHSPPQRYKKRTWKKNNNHKRKTGYQQQQHVYNSQYPHPTNNDSHNHHRGKRKSRLYSTSKLKRNVINGNTNGNINGNGGGGNNLTSNYPSLHHGSTMSQIVNGSVNGNVGSNISNSGKYIPPYLRSPAYQKSPAIEPLTEDLDHLNLNNDYDEVFHLEGDFDMARNGDNDDQYDSHIDDVGNGPHDYHLNVAGDFPHKRNPKPDVGFMHQHHPTATTITSGVNGQVQAQGQTHGRRNSTSFSTSWMLNTNRRAGAIFGNELPLASNNTNSLPNQTNSVNGGGINTNSNGKYVPPFRRNSVSSSHGTANGTGTNAAAGIASFRKSVNERKNSLEFANGSGTSGGSRPVSSPLTELKNHHQNHLQEVNKSRFNKLIPVGLELVSSFRKDWCDYD